MKQLQTLLINDNAIIKKIINEGDITQRFIDLGIEEGASIKLLLISPSKRMKAYYIKGSLIA
ncbi:MAG: hypothetical protein RR425_06290, partial [Erysipelotrichales bacterium]